MPYMDAKTSKTAYAAVAFLTGLFLLLGSIAGFSFSTPLLPGFLSIGTLFGLVLIYLGYKLHKGQV